MGKRKVGKAKVSWPSKRWARRLKNLVLLRFPQPLFASALAIAVLLGVTTLILVKRSHAQSEEISTSGPMATEVREGEPESQPWNYFHPSWKRESFSMLPLSVISHASELDATARNIVGDPRGRVEKEFQVPAGLRDRVVFWIQIYSRFSSRMRVVHDRNNPGTIYGYIDFRPLYNSFDTTIAAEVHANAIEKQILKELKNRLKEGISPGPAKTLDPSEKAQIQGFLSRVGAFSLKDTEHLAENIRTQSGQADYFQQALFRSRNLLPHIESVFRRQALPVALGRIPFVESSFNVRAYSKGGAMGIWQFMPETARQMIRGSDESAWSDPIKQTASAARVFKLYRSVLPDWGTTVTSYNSGVGRVRKLCEKHHLKDVEGLISLNGPDGLGFAGKNFYSEFLAANLVETYKDELFDYPREGRDSSIAWRGFPTVIPKEVCEVNWY